MTVAQVRGKSRGPLVMLVLGALLLVGGLIASAAVAFLTKTNGRVLTTPTSNPLALEFAPPDYTALWICLGIAAIGLVALVVGVIATVRSRPTPSGPLA